MHRSLLDLGVVSLDFPSKVVTSHTKLYWGKTLWLVRYDQKKLFIGCNSLVSGPIGMIQERQMCPFGRGMDSPQSHVESRSGRGLKTRFNFKNS